MVLTEAVQALARTGDPEDLAVVSALMDADALALQVEAAGAVLTIRAAGS
jgi:hypothetical protein